MITPAISVLSAVEGLEVATPALEPFVVPLTVAILIGALRDPEPRHGPRRRAVRPGDGGLVRDARGARHARHRAGARPCWPRSRPGTRSSSSPRTAGTASSCSASVFLVVTGGEALYADMGHFGRRPIRAGLVRARAAGAAAQLLRPGRAAAPGSGGGRRTRSTAWRPRWALYPLVALATRGHRDRLAGADLGRLLAHAPGDPARLLPAARRQPHLGARERPDLHRAGQLGADGRSLRARARLRLVREPRRRVRHRGDRDHGDHDRAAVRGRAAALGLGRRARSRSAR